MTVVSRVAEERYLTIGVVPRSLLGGAAAVAAVWTHGRMPAIVRAGVRSAS